MTQEVIDLHTKHTGVLGIQPMVPLLSSNDLAKLYTPGVAELSLMIEKDHDLARTLTMSGKLVAVVTDGSAVLGLGNVGSQAGLPIVEGKALLYKTLADVDAIPLAMEQVSVDEMVQTLVNLQGSFAGIHLEDIAAPACFELEEKLQAALNIPVYHDDQEGTAIVVAAGLINAAKLAGKALSDLRVLINGMGASGVATAKLLLHMGITKLTLLDKAGVLSCDSSSLNQYQKDVLIASERIGQGDTLEEAIMDQDVFIGLSTGNLLTSEMVMKMNSSPIVFALANPVPEILPEEAKRGGATIIATGSSQYPNQVNNILAFPGLYKGLIETQATQVTLGLQRKVAYALACLVGEPTEDKFIPQVFDEGVSETVAQAVRQYMVLEKG